MSEKNPLNEYIQKLDEYYEGCEPKKFESDCVSEGCNHDHHSKDKKDDEKNQANKSKFRFKIEHDRPNCIGCGACAALQPEKWEMDQDGKSNIVCGKKLSNGQEELFIEDKDHEAHLEAAQACPVNVIHIRNLESDEREI